MTTQQPSPWVMDTRKSLSLELCNSQYTAFQLRGPFLILVSLSFPPFSSSFVP